MPSWQGNQKGQKPVTVFLLVFSGTLEYCLLISSSGLSRFIISFFPLRHRKLHFHFLEKELGRKHSLRS